MHPIDPPSPPLSALQGDTVLIAVNPRAGSGDQMEVVEEVALYLKDLDFDAQVCTDVDQIVALSESLAAAGKLRGVLTAGGDGSAALMLNRLPPGTPIAMLPLGTENLLADYLCHRAELEFIGRLFSGGMIARLDCGESNGCLFHIMAGCGFDADVVRRLHSTRTGNIWHLSYVKPILDSIRTYAYPPLKVTLRNVAGDLETIECSWAFVLNIPRYAGGLQVVPQATPFDGLLDLCTFKDGSLLAGLTYLSGVVMGGHLEWEGVVHRRVSWLRIESADPDAPVQLDGDPGGTLPIEVRCQPRRLSVIVARDWIARHFGDAIDGLD